MNITQIIGMNISRAQQENNVSNQELAGILGVTRQTVGKYIKGEQPIDSEKLYILANYFNKPFTYFIQKEENEVVLPKNNFIRVVSV